jgi:hypothetical protein
MRHTLALYVAVTVALACAAKEPENYAVYPDAGIVYHRDELVKHGVWVTGDVINDPKEGLMFRTDKPVEGNTKGTLVYLGLTEDLATTFAPMCYRAAERHMQLRLHGAFLPHSGPKDPNHPNVNFVIWKIHMPTDPDDLPPDQKIIMGPDKAIPGYTIIPKKP